MFRFRHRLQRLRRLRRIGSSDPVPEFQVAPMADILLVLLVFFMSITTTEFFHPDHLIHLPTASTGEGSAGQSGEMVINVGWIPGARTGSIKIESQTLSDPGALIPLLQARLQKEPALRVLIRADKNVEYRYVASILKACRQAQLPHVVFSVLGSELN